MCIQAGDVILFGARHRFLRLHNFYGVRHAGSETIRAPGSTLILGKLAPALRHAHLIGGRIDVEEGVSHIGFHAGLQVLILFAALLEQRVGTSMSPLIRPPSQMGNLSWPVTEKVPCEVAGLTPITP